MNSETAALISLANERFMACFRAGDKDGFSRLYTEDALLLLPNVKALAGRAGAMQFFDSLREKGIAQIRLITHELEDSGDTAWERGAAEALSSGGAILGRSKYIVIWKRTAGGWALHRDILNAEPAA